MDMQADTALIWNPILRHYLVNAPNRMNRREGTTVCPFCEDIIQGRVDPEKEAWQAFLPPYACYPYEIHLYPQRHMANLSLMQDDELHDFAEILLHVIRGYNALFDGAMLPVPYLLGIHQLADERFHLHVEIQAIARAPGKLKYAASSEALWDLWTNDSLPSQKAQELRDALAKVTSG
jgi:UDPglucose--hexose-1-phosphate uridylyltransferase